MRLIEVTTPDAPGLEPYFALTEAQLRGTCEQPSGLFIAESPKVIHVALTAGYEPVSLLCEKSHITGDAAILINRCPQTLPVYTGEREVLTKLTGYKLTRGVLCAMRRHPLPTVESICGSGRCVAVIDGVCDTTNIGAIFRCAAALGVDAVLLTPDACDPLNRRAVRVSMGSVFLVPWTRTDKSLTALKKLGYKVAALALGDDALPIDAPAPAAEHRLALRLGTEGDGLSPRAVSEADYVLRIPMIHNVDSLNVAAAAAIAFWQLRVK